MVPQTMWFYKDVGHTQEAKKELIEFVEFKYNENVLNSVKPTRLIQKMLQIGTSPDSEDIILDFFAGSAPTGHAIFKQNQADGGRRRFVLVQLPEVLPTPEPGMRTIFDIGLNRLRNAIQKSLQNDQGLLPKELEQDLGFKVFRLSESNFKPWNAEAPHDEKTLAQQLELHIDHIRDSRSAEDILYEILLKSGFPLTTPVATLTLAGKTVHSVAAGALFICLERELTPELIRAMAERQPERVVCLDEGFAGNDQLKANAVQIFKTKGVTSFKTV